MKFSSIGQFTYPWQRILQESGYHQHNNSWVRRVGGDQYPRWHIYANEVADDNVVFNIHLDQRAGVHQGATAHAGNYDGDIVKDEVERILSFFQAHQI
ncbi:MAG: hypothetical protein ACKKL5_03320 [Candidatus Komeilibacteria bacterium]